MIAFRFARLPPVAVLLLATACGGGGGGPGPEPPPPPPPPPPTAVIPTFVNLTSDAGDSIGGGRNYSYSNADARIALSAEGGRLTVDLRGDESWSATFQLPDSSSELQAGSYLGLQRYPFHDHAVGGLSWFAFSAACNTLTGWFRIDSVVYEGSTLSAIDLQFEQHCEGRAPALHGEIHWDARDKTVPSGPVVPAPEGLWEPDEGATPATGNYVYLESPSGDPIGAGINYLYTETDAVLRVSAANGRLSVSAAGDEVWFGDMQVMSTLSRPEVGYYDNLQPHPLVNPVKAGWSWRANGRSCSSMTGWVIIDSVTYNDVALRAVDLRFEQYCEGSSFALHGKIHWNADDTTSPPGPVVPPPAGLWEPGEGATPATGNYVYLESEPGDYIGAGSTYLYTLADSLLGVITEGATLRVIVQGDEQWDGYFQPMSTLSRVEVGYYGDLQRYPFHNTTKGGLDWYGEARGCGSVTGWFVVDDVAYEGETVTALDMRFEQHCEDGGPALHGAIHWDASDPTLPPGPVVPPPVGLWEPAAGVTPSTGNFFYLESEPGDYVGAGLNYLYTQADSQFTVTTSAKYLYVEVDGDERWTGEFQVMIPLSRIEVGYYGDLRRYPFHNWAKGGMDWNGEGRGCNNLSGWFVVDSVTYDGDTLTAIDLRFEQHCEYKTPALHGQIHWDAGDATAPAGPVVPPPAGLWQPPAGATPASGNYAYLASEPGDYIGAGAEYLYVPADSQFKVTKAKRLVRISVAGAEEWLGDFQSMSTLDRIEAGYYGNIRRRPFINPATAGMSWSGEGRICSTLSGWFVVDSITYDGDVLTAIDLRFEQHCEGGAPALRGKIHWSQ